jgi:enoyl-CoA hydratase/carnithine racemase
MSYETLLYEIRGEVALVHLNRPDRLNAYTRQMRHELEEAIERVNTDPALGAMVLTGAGRGFCAGADIQDTFKSQMDAGPARADSSGARHWVNLVRRSKPLVAAVNGHSVGVGLTMILGFDIILCSENARFQCAFAKMGVVTELGSSHFLVQRMGFGRASDLALTARRIDGEEAVRLGLADRLVPHERLVEEAVETADQIAQNPDRPLRMMKELFSRNGSEQDLDAVIERETEYLYECYGSLEHKEAVNAFLEKRAPVFIRR